MTTFLFWFQVVMAWIYTAPLVWGIASGNTKGLTLAMYAIFLAYLALSFSLALASYRIQRDTIRKQTVLIFAQWIVFTGAILFVGLGRVVWRPSDTEVCLAILALSIVTVIKYRGLREPFSRAFLAVWCKAVPQLWLAATIASARSGEGLPLISLLAGHCTAIPRLIQIGLAGRTKGWDRPTLCLLIGESANVVTWIIVTIVWVYFKN